MSRTSLHSPRYKALRDFLIKRRKEQQLSQTELADRIGRYQSFIADLERGERRLDVIEFLEIADALEIDSAAALKRISAART